MRKKKALILFGGLTVLWIGYVIWCSREYYIPPQLTWDDGVSESDREELAERVVRDHCGQPPWSIRELIYDVAYPYQVKIIRVHILAPTGDECVVKASGAGGEFELLYVREGGSWRYMLTR